VGLLFVLFFVGNYFYESIEIFIVVVVVVIIFIIVVINTILFNFEVAYSAQFYSSYIIMYITTRVSCCKVCIIFNDFKVSLTCLFYFVFLFFL